jgi:hypothetical protein
MHDPLLDSFWRYVSPEPNSGCWLWTGACCGHGYGRFSPKKGRMHIAHRFSYTNYVGPIPENLQIDHLCRVRSCVNPSHLEAVSARENTLRSAGVTASNYRKTHCPKGHEYDFKNTYITAIGGRRCRTCQRENASRTSNRAMLQPVKQEA